MTWRVGGVAKYVTTSFGRWLVVKSLYPIGISRCATPVKARSEKEIGW
jgi:hypothetical protein